MKYEAIINLQKLRERGAVKKIKTSHYYRLTDKGYVWLFYSFYNYSYFINLLISDSYKKELQKFVDNHSNIEGEYAQINKTVSIVMAELGMAA